VAKDFGTARFFPRKTPTLKAEQFLTEAKGRRTGVVLDLQTCEHLRAAEEALAAIRAYDALHDRAHTEIGCPGSPPKNKQCEISKLAKVKNTQTTQHLEDSPATPEFLLKKLSLPDEIA
jgi:hypothetical protein